MMRLFPALTALMLTVGVVSSASAQDRRPADARAAASRDRAEDRTEYRDRQARIARLDAQHARERAADKSEYRARQTRIARLNAQNAAQRAREKAAYRSGPARGVDRDRDGRPDRR